MKKYLFLGFIFTAVIATSAVAQTGSGPAATGQASKESEATAVLQQMKKIVPQMVEKTGITDAQANRVIELNYEMRMAAGNLRDLSEEERKSKIAELKADKEKKMSELLTADQIKAVKSFYEEMGKNRQKGS
jgi:polyhydroxyalkanoate synthesis regulator phasin